MKAMKKKKTCAKGTYNKKKCTEYTALFHIAANADNTIREAVGQLRFEIAQAAAKTSEEAESSLVGESSTQNAGRRGGGGLGATASFSIAASSNTAGNDEEDDLGETDSVG